MDTSVCRAVTAGDEGFSADIASVGSLTRVNPHVPPQIGGRTERRRTFPTLEGLNIRVDSQMAGEMCSLSEGR